MLMFLTCTVALLLINAVRLEYKLAKALDAAERCNNLLQQCRFSLSENEAELRRHNEWFYLVADKIGQLHDKISH